MREQLEAPNQYSFILETSTETTGSSVAYKQSQPIVSELTYSHPISKINKQDHGNSVHALIPDILAPLNASAARPPRSASAWRGYIPARLGARQQTIQQKISPSVWKQLLDSLSLTASPDANTFPCGSPREN